jgi:hypothetical protein
MERRPNKKQTNKTIAIVVAVIAALCVAGAIVFLLVHTPAASSPPPPPPAPSTMSEAQPTGKKPAAGPTTTAKGASKPAKVSATAPVPLSSSGDCLGGYAPTANDEQCDVAIVGTGPAGLFAAYRLRLQSPSSLRICLIDKRPYVGGKVHSIEAPQSTPANRLYGPTCAEQLRYTDINMRCLAQTMGIKSYSRHVPMNNEYLAREYNVTNVCPECYLDPNTLLYGSQERYLAPNGIAPVPGMAYPVQLAGLNEGLPADCCSPSQNYTQCSYMDCLFNKLVYISNKDKADITNVGSFEEWAYERTGSDAAKRYFGSQLGYYYELMQPQIPVQARAGYDYLYSDWNAPWAGTLYVEGGPQQIWKGVNATLAVRSNYKFMQNETVTCFDNATDALAATYPYVLRTSKRNVRAKRVLFGISPYDFVENIGGTRGLQIAAQLTNMGLAEPYAQCTADLFYATKWWKPARNQCTDGVCFDPVYGAHPNITNATGWTFYDTSNGFWLRWIPTPSRNQMNMVRFYPDSCENWIAVYKARGEAGIARDITAHLRTLFAGVMDVPDVLRAGFNYEPAAYSYISARAPPSVTYQSLLDYCKAPAGNEKIAFITEQCDWLNSGWEEGAANVVRNAFDGPALADLNTNAIRAEWDQCTNTRDGRTLRANDLNRLVDECYLLGTETHILDYYGMNYCPTSTLKKKRSADQPFTAQEVREISRRNRRLHPV